MAFLRLPNPIHDPILQSNPWNPVAQCGSAQPCGLLFGVSGGNKKDGKREKGKTRRKERGKEREKRRKREKGRDEPLRWWGGAGGNPR